MSSSEAQIRAEATSACERLAADYESRLATVSAELDRTRQELAVRTHTLAAELNRCACGCAFGWGGAVLRASATVEERPMSSRRVQH